MMFWDGLLVLSTVICVSVCVSACDKESAFTFSKANSNKWIPEFSIEDYIFCNGDSESPVLFAKGSQVPWGLYAFVDPTNDVLSCVNTRTGNEVGTANILQYFNHKVTRPPEIPVDWYDGKRVLLKLNFNTYDRGETVRCTFKYTHTFLWFKTNYEIWIDVTAG